MTSPHESSTMELPPPMWQPTEKDWTQSPLGAWMRELGYDDVNEFHRSTAENREAFWQRAISELAIQFRHQPAKILQQASSVEDVLWLPQAKLNIVESCFAAPATQDAIVAGRDGKITRRWSYRRLSEEMVRVSCAIEAAGFRPGDALAVCLPMTPESVAIYLGIIHAGCRVVSIADSFAAPEIANRLRIAKAKAVFTYDVMTRAGKVLPLYERVRQATELLTIVLKEDESSHDFDLRETDQSWESFLGQAATASLDKTAHEALPDDAINILFSSGTTGDPKAIPWNHLTPIKCATDAMLLQDIRPAEVLAWPTNLGWMMGPWLIFASLLRRGTIALYEDAPLGEGFGKFIEQAKVNMLGVVPTLVRAWRQSQCMEACDWNSIRCFSSTGESSQADDMRYLSGLAGKRPVIEYCGGTEIGGGYISSTCLQPNIPSSFSTPAFGLDVKIVDEQGHASSSGELFLVPPSIGLSQELLNRDHHETYYADTPTIAEGLQLRRHGDYFVRFDNGYFAAGGRADDTMNLGGIKVSSAEIERVLNLLDGVLETAAVAVNDSHSGPSRLVVFTVLESSGEQDEPQQGPLLKQMNQAIKRELNPLFKIDSIQVVESLPRTASNKVMRRMLRAKS